MFCSVMNYVALRLLGEGLDSNGALLQARNWILVHGGATLTPSWGKFFLSVGNIITTFKYILIYISFRNCSAKWKRYICAAKNYSSYVCWIFKVAREIPCSIFTNVPALGPWSI
jgi:hypothetical protein